MRPVRKTLALSLAFWAAATAARAAPPPQAQEEPTFKVDVSLVTLLVNVKDARGAPIADLEAEDFQVVDGGVEREIAVFERRTNRPLSVALMIDASLSTAKELRFERAEAKRFLESLLGPGSHPRDRAAILQFSDYVDLLTDFTSSQRRLAQALREVKAVSGTSIYDAILLASQHLEGRSGRRIMVIITDGGDTTSRISFHEALQAAHGVDAVIYGILVVPIRSDAGRNTGGEHALKTLVSHTGGETFVQHGTDDLDQAFREILQSLRTQYLIAYYPPVPASSRETFRRTEVTVRRVGARVFSRSGYYLSPSPAPPRTSERIRIRPRNPRDQPESDSPNRQESPASSEKATRSEP